MSLGSGVEPPTMPLSPMDSLLNLLRKAFAQTEEVTTDKIAVASIRSRLENVILFCEYLESDHELPH